MGGVHSFSCHLSKIIHCIDERIVGPEYAMLGRCPGAARRYAIVRRSWRSRMDGLIRTAFWYLLLGHVFRGRQVVIGLLESGIGNRRTDPLHRLSQSL